MGLIGCGIESSNNTKYQVLIGEDSENIKKFPAADILVIDGEYFSTEDLDDLRNKGVKKIYSYLNIGSLEDFRDYYDAFSDCTLGAYDHWPEEKWVDVSKVKWQNFIGKKAGSLAQKGFDGFFIDNIDVYYQYPKDEIYDGIVQILTGLQKLKHDVIINGGDVFVRRYIESGDNSSKLFTGVNQEDVYTSYDFLEDECKLSSDESREYLQEYLDLVAQNGFDVYVLEYAKDPKIKKDAEAYSKNNGWVCYVADNILLKLNA